MTAALHEICFDENQPIINILLTIYVHFTGLSHADVKGQFAGRGYVLLKQELAKVIIESLCPLQSRYRELIKKPDHID